MFPCSDYIVNPDFRTWMARVCDWLGMSAENPPFSSRCDSADREWLSLSIAKAVKSRYSPSNDRRGFGALRAPSIVRFIETFVDVWKTLDRIRRLAWESKMA